MAEMRLVISWHNLIWGCIGNSDPLPFPASQAVRKPTTSQTRPKSKPNRGRGFQMANGTWLSAARNPQSAVRLSPGNAVATSARKWARSRLHWGISIGIRITIPRQTSLLLFLAFFISPAICTGWRAAERLRSSPTFCHFRLLSCFLANGVFVYPCGWVVSGHSCPPKLALYRFMSKQGPLLSTPAPRENVFPKPSKFNQHCGGLLCN